MSEPKFNLVDEPWLLALDASGTPTELGLLEAFRRAPNLLALDGELPTQTFANLRLMLAVAYRALDRVGGYDDEYGWEALWGRYDLLAEAVEAYLTDPDVHDRFWLLHPSAPFFQVPNLAAAKVDARTGEVASPFKEPSVLMMDVVNDVKRRAFSTRCGPALTHLTCAQAARWLVHTQAYMTAGALPFAAGDGPGVCGRSKAGSNTSNSAPQGIGLTGLLSGQHLVGTDLARTIMLNLVLSPQVVRREAGTDLPAWERPVQTFRPRADILCGPVDAYTWQAARIELAHDGDGVVGAAITAGDSTNAVLVDRQHADPMSTWVTVTKDDVRTTRPQRHNFTTSPWLSSAALLGVSAKASEPVTAPLREWVATLVAIGVLDGLDGVTVRVVGPEYVSNSTRVGSMLDDTLTFRAASLADEQGARGLVVDAVAGARAAVGALGDFGKALANLSGAVQDPKDDAKAGRVVNVRRAIATELYSELRAPFDQWLLTVRSDSDHDERLAEWYSTVRTLVQRKRDDLLAAAPPRVWRPMGSTKTAVDLGTARHALGRALNKALGPSRRAA